MYNVEEYEPFLKKLQEVQGEQTIKSENLNDEELEEEE
jgi:hypothetical protein